MRWAFVVVDPNRITVIYFFTIFNISTLSLHWLVTIEYLSSKHLATLKCFTPFFQVGFYFDTKSSTFHFFSFPKIQTLTILNIAANHPPLFLRRSRILFLFKYFRRKFLNSYITVQLIKYFKYISLFNSFVQHIAADSAQRP